MDIKQIKSIWAAWQEVQEKKAPVTKKDDDGEGMDPVGKADADIDNDGDTDSSDKYLAKRRKAIGKAMKKEGKIPPQLKANAEKMKKGELPNQKNEEKTECPKCEGKGCDHCEGKGYHMSEGENDGNYPSPEKKKKAGDALEPVNNRTAKLKEDETDTPYPSPKKVKKPGDALEPVNNRTAKLKESELFSSEELAALEEKAPPEEFMSTSSPKEKKVMADHKAGSSKHIENLDKVEDADIVKAGKAVKSQSPARNAGDNLSVGDNAMKTPAKAKGQ